jgi:hypothetical protein
VEPSGFTPLLFVGKIWQVAASSEDVFRVDGWNHAVAEAVSFEQSEL